MDTPSISCSSPAARCAATTRKDSRRLAATLSNSMHLQYRPEPTSHQPPTGVPSGSHGERRSPIIDVGPIARGAAASHPRPVLGGGLRDDAGRGHLHRPVLHFVRGTLHQRGPPPVPSADGLCVLRFCVGLRTV